MNKKYYPVETGLRRVAVTRAGADRGKSLECATFIALRRRFSEVHFFRKLGGVDFVVHAGQRILPIQVTWEGLSPRHESSLSEFYEVFPQADESVTVTRATFANLDAVLGPPSLQATAGKNRGFGP
jgi:predicted AAA+ superfamily ATPase